MRLFVTADKQDRAGNFGKNVVKCFYSAGVLLDVMETFGELSPESAHYRKYAKMKAAYIHNCLKNGEVSGAAAALSIPRGKVKAIFPDQGRGNLFINQGQEGRIFKE